MKKKLSGSIGTIIRFRCDRSGHTGHHLLKQGDIKKRPELSNPQKGTT